MVYKSNYDKSTHIILAIIVLVCSPILISPIASMLRMQDFSIGLCILALVGAGCVFIPLWICYSIRYQFTSQYLLVKAAFIRIRIPYKQIRSVEKAAQKWEGLRISASGEAIHITYDSGDIKISPTPMNQFLQELCSLCPTLKLNVPEVWKENNRD